MLLSLLFCGHGRERERPEEAGERSHTLLGKGRERKEESPEDQEVKVSIVTTCACIDHKFITYLVTGKLYLDISCRGNKPSYPEKLINLSDDSFPYYL